MYPSLLTPFAYLGTTAPPPRSLISGKNDPLYLNSFGEDESAFHFMVHSVLDVFDERRRCASVRSSSMCREVVLPGSRPCICQLRNAPRVHRSARYLYGFPSAPCPYQTHDLQHPLTSLPSLLLVYLSAPLPPSSQYSHNPLKCAHALLYPPSPGDDASVGDRSFLGLLCPIGEYKVYGYTTITQVKIIIIMRDDFDRVNDTDVRGVRSTEKLCARYHYC